MKTVLAALVFLLCLNIAVSRAADEAGPYIVNSDDILNISVLKPEAIGVNATVAPDGTVSFPYIGTVAVAGSTLEDIQQIIQDRLSDGYMRYPVVTVTLVESRSRKFFVYGEVVRPGSYILTPDTTVLKAISIAGGFTKFGSAGRVRVLRPRENAPGYETIRVNIRSLMKGSDTEDIVLKPGDMVVVGEGVF
jgi:polysaccharide export outer membrane protein